LVHICVHGGIKTYLKLGNVLKVGRDRETKGWTKIGGVTPGKENQCYQSETLEAVRGGRREDRGKKWRDVGGKTGPWGERKAGEGGQKEKVSARTWGRTVPDLKIGESRRSETQKKAVQQDRWKCEGGRGVYCKNKRKKKKQHTQQQKLGKRKERKEGGGETSPRNKAWGTKKTGGPREPLERTMIEGFQTHAEAAQVKPVPKREKRKTPNTKVQEKSDQTGGRQKDGDKDRPNQKKTQPKKTGGTTGKGRP